MNIPNKEYHHLLNQIINNAIPEIQKIELENFNYKESKSKWSKKEILGHLIDSAYNNHQRFLRANHQSNLIFDGYRQDDWVILNNYQNRDKEEILNTWVVANQHLSKLIEGIPDNLLNRKSKEHTFHKISMNLLGENDTTTLSYLVWDYLFHLEHHLSQIISNYKKIVSGFEEA